jgi:hypothetical protein
VLRYCVRDYDVTVDSGIPSASTNLPNYGNVSTTDDLNNACWTAEPDSITEMDNAKVEVTMSFPQQEQTIA